MPALFFPFALVGGCRVWRDALQLTTYASNMNANIAFHALITTHTITHVRITNTRSGRSREIPVAGLDRIAGTDIPEYTLDLLSEIEIDEATLTMRAGDEMADGRWKMAHCFSIHGRIRTGLVLLLAWYALALAASSDEPTPAESFQLAQVQTVATCGQSRCDCGAASLISEEKAPCNVTSFTGQCDTGSGWCCVCAGGSTVAVCADSFCDCTNSTLLSRTSAPCKVTSSAGSCRIDSGSCCLCALE